MLNLRGLRVPAVLLLSFSPFVLSFPLRICLPYDRPLPRLLKCERRISRRPPLDAVKAHVDTPVDPFEFELAKAKKKSVYRKGEAIVDEDGFTLVTRGGAYGQAHDGGVGVASKTFQATGRTGSKKKREPK
ncbi:hypothetical protein BS17DRAFT_783512 [Gyrodon lividus]|nr:hypothetical protein BS17DRAFT_783512 [Gyrodon lividus]